MADGIEITIDADALLLALARLGDAAQPFVDAAVLVTANNIDREASARLRRQLSSASTGVTEAGITVTKAEVGGGLVVGASRQQFPNLPLWIEKGTKKGTRKGNSGGGMAARPFFYSSAMLEEGPHFARVARAIQDAIDTQGLGE